MCVLVFLVGIMVVRMSENGARKFDSGKAPITTGLLWRFPRAIKEVAKVSAVGAEKYEVTLPDDNCLRVENGFNRYADAIARHLVDRIIDGPINNEKGGALPPEGRNVRHLAQLIWDGLTCLEIELIDEETTKEATNPVPSWWENWQAKRYPSPAAAASTPDHPSPSPHSHSHTSSGQEHTDPKDDLRKAWEDYSAHLNNAGKPLAHTHS